MRVEFTLVLLGDILKLLQCLNFCYDMNEGIIIGVCLRNQNEPQLHVLQFKEVVHLISLLL